MLSTRVKNVFVYYGAGLASLRMNWKGDGSITCCITCCFEKPYSVVQLLQYF